MALKDVVVPDIGNYANVDIIEVLVKAGDTIKKEQSLITLETDKATMEIPASDAGVVKEVLVKPGDKVSKGSLILRIESADSAAAAPAKPDTKAAAAPQPNTAAAAIVEVIVPDIGNYSNVDIIEVLVKSGDSIKKEQSLITLETDKATMEIPSTVEGTVKEILVKAGDKVSKGSPILRAEIKGAAPANTQATKTPTLAVSTENAPQVSREPSQPATSGYVHAGPAVRQLARELGVDLTKVTGTGPKNRIIRDDVVKYVKTQLQSGGESAGASLGLLADPVVDFAEFGQVRVEKLTRIKKMSGANLARNWVRIPHITLFDEADIGEFEDFRAKKKAEVEKMGVKLTPLPFLVKAVASSLKHYPLVNSSLSADGENLVFKDYIHIGVAVDTPIGLMVPVIRNADQKGLFQIAKELMDMSLRAREGKLKGEEMKGGTFTISSLGSLGTTAFTPIVNMPEVGILGLSRAEMKPKWNGKTFEPKLMLPLSLSLDHRVVDGAEGARFLSHLVKALSDLRELLL